MTGVARITKLDFFIMKSQGISYLSLVAVILLFGLMGSSITVLCITGAWFIALMATNIFAIQEKNHLDRLYGSVCVSLNEVVLGRYTFVFLNYFTSMVVIIILYLGFVLCRKATFDVPDIMLGLGLSFLVFSTITGIQMPLFFKMGYTKAKLWSVIPFAVVMLLVVLPSFVSALSGILDFAQSHKELFAFACILTSCIIQFVSYRIAVIFYRKGFLNQICKNIFANKFLGYVHCCIGITPFTLWEYATVCIHYICIEQYCLHFCGKMEKNRNESGVNDKAK